MMFKRFLASGPGRLPAPSCPVCQGRLSPASAGRGEAVSALVASGDEDCVFVCGPSVVAVETGCLGVCAVVLKLSFQGLRPPRLPGFLVNGQWPCRAGGRANTRPGSCVVEGAAASLAGATSMRWGATPAGRGAGPSVSPRRSVRSLFCMVWPRY